jgi:hypothetical protein
MLHRNIEYCNAQIFVNDCKESRLLAKRDEFARVAPADRHGAAKVQAGAGSRIAAAASRADWRDGLSTKS